MVSAAPNTPGAATTAPRASDVGTTVRKIGGTLGVAVLSTVFVTYGSTEGPQRFVDGPHPAVWIGAGVVFFGALCALRIPHRPRPAPSASCGQAGLSPRPGRPLSPR